ncbi:MAG: multicopper oxidase type [Beijerinckiaceae bacterium]|nr:MAG: multicopper oxidase type [Beijerinckiaceae bacterium]
MERSVRKTTTLPPMPPANPPGSAGFVTTRRAALMAVSAVLLAPLPAFGQPRAAPAAGTKGAGKPAQPSPIVPARTVRLRAEALRKRLGSPEQPESTLFRLVELAADGKPIESAFTVLRGKEGEPFALEIENALARPTAFHLRGLRGLNAFDGVPGLTSQPIAPGSKATIVVPASQTGTFILSPCLPDMIAEQNARGLHGVVIVEEKNPPPFDHDLVLAVSDWRLDDKGVLAEDFLDRRDSTRVGRLGNTLAANAGPAPGTMTVRPGARLRIRMVNVSNARVIPLKVSGFTAEVYSIDSTPCQPFDPLKRTVILAPASRIEMVLQAPPEAGKDGAIEAKVAAGIPIFSYKTAGEPLPAKDKLAALPDPGLPPAIRLQDATRIDLTITGGIGLQPAEAELPALTARFPDARAIFRINDGRNAGFAGKPVASLKRGKVLVMALMNRTSWPQVLAVHGHAFRLLHPFDDGWEPYFLDTLYLVPNATARIALIADNPGKWAIRSTIAEHFATGVSTWFEVT